MKSYIFFSCMIIFGFNPNNGLSQNSIIKIDDSKVMSVEMVFEMIKSNTNYEFLYSTEDLKYAPLVSISSGSQNVKDLLEQALKRINCTYEIINNTVIVKKMENQQTEISGYVRDSDGNPLAGATITINDEARGTLTDLDGKFEVQVELGDVLNISYLGFKPETVTVDSDRVYNIVLSEDVNNLDEVLVTGYQKIDVNKSTGSAKVLDAELLDRKGNPNVLSSLEGMIAGLVLSADPTNEGQQRIDIRGVSSIQGDSRPLIVVDGFPLEGDISTINPYEVESVTVLRDAAAASIYGARAANGVIVITTKRGQEGKVSVNYRSELTVQDKPDLSYRLNRLGSADLIDLVRRDLENQNPHTYQWYLENSSNPSSQQFARNLAYETFAKVNEGLITEAEGDAILNRLSQIDNTPQWQDYFFKAQIQQQHNISVNGGSDRYRFRTSLNYTRTEGNRVGDVGDRLIFDILNDFKVSDKMKIELGVNVVFNSEKQTPYEFSFIENISPFENLVGPNGEALAVRLPLGGNSVNNGGYFGGKDPMVIQNLLDNGLFDETYRSLDELGMYNNEGQGLSARFQTRLSYDFTSFLTGRFDFQYETGNYSNEELWDADSFQIYNLINNTAPVDFSGNPGEFLIPIGERIINEEGRRNSYTLRGQFDFNKNFGQFSTTALVGTEVRNVFNKSIITDRFGYNDGTLLFRYIDKRALQEDILDVQHPRGAIAGGIPFSDDFTETINRFFSLYGNATVGYDNRYILSGSMRNDQSNLFGTDPKYRYKPFWSVGAKWRVSEEDFFQSSLINNLALRASYGINGNISNRYGPFHITEALFSGRLDDVNSLAITTPAINDLRWEKTATTNFGMDLSMFNNRLNLTLDIYNKDTQDVIANGEADPTQGFPFLVYNDANIENRGYEVSLQTTNVNSQKFRWSSILTFRHNKNKVTKSFADEELAYYAAGLANYEGGPASSYWFYDFQGLNEEGEVVVLDENGEEQVANSFGIFALPTSALVNAGSTIPIYTAGLTNNINYGNLGLSFLFVGSGGHVLVKDSFNGGRVFSSSCLYKISCVV